MNTLSVCLRVSRCFIGSALFSLAAAQAQVVLVPTTPQLGSSNPITPEPLVTRPATTPCIVPILNEASFIGFSGNPITYTPPAACPGPWAKVVLTVDLTVSAGRQFDRTAEFIIGGANIFYGTTAEPRRTLSPSWHVERDITDLSAIFQKPQTGIAEIGNVVDTTYTGIIYANAALEFYPASAAYPAPLVADIVVPVDDTGGDAGSVNSGQQITQVLNLPTNVEKAYLDVISQSQSNDEFWYLNVPNDQTSNLETYGNTAFRETEITLDGIPAGVAPVYPWIYTGGLDPYLWEPITGVQTLDFKPYRVDLTPFAGVLTDGQPHTVGIGVYNADNYFLVTGNVLVFLDHGAKVTTGGVIGNTLAAAPIPVVQENLTTTATGTTTGTVTVSSARDFTITGYLQTSHGTVLTSVAQVLDFINIQSVDVNPNSGPDDQNVVQNTTVNSITTTRNGPTTTIETKRVAYPFKLDYVFNYNPDGTYTQTVTSQQQDSVFNNKIVNGKQLYNDIYTEQTNSTDILFFNASFNITAAGIGDSSANYFSKDSLGNCYSRTLTSDAHVLTAISDNKECQ